MLRPAQPSCPPCPASSSLSLPTSLEGHSGPGVRPVPLPDCCRALCSPQAGIQLGNLCLAEVTEMPAQAD